MKGSLIYTVKGDLGPSMGCIEGITQRQAEDHVEWLRLREDVKEVLATFNPYPVVI